MFNFKRKEGMVDIIRCDEPDYLIWKWHPADTALGESKRENAIRWGSSLRVKDGEVAVFVYRQKGESNQDYIVGPFDATLKTANLPVLSSILGLAYGGGTPFQAEVYFINLARIIQVKFGVPYFDVYDPRFEDFGVPVSVRGTISFRIGNCCEFVRIHRLIDFSLETFQKQIRDAVSRYVKDTVANAPAAYNIPLVQIEAKTAQVNDAIEYDIKQRLGEDFGVLVSGVDISAIELDKSSEGYHRLMAVTRDVAETKVKAETTDYVERLRIQREEGQYALHKQTQSANIGAYQIEKQAEVGVAGAEAFGKMGSNDAGNVNLGGDGAGFNPAAMMAGMALSGAVGQNLAGTMNSMLSGINQQPNPGVVPPPIPTAAYHVVINGQAAGPFDMATLTQMATDGRLNAESLVWKTGMSQWEKAGNTEDLKAILSGKSIVPPIPPQE